MRILHCGDIHLGELAGPVIDGENARLMDTVRCMDYLAQKAQEEQVDAILICGDLFHKSKLWADQMLKEIGIAAEWLRKLTQVAPTVLMFGTRNHDNIEAFGNLQAMNIPNLKIITEPHISMIMTNSGPLQVAAVPGFDKGYFRSKFPGMAPEEENQKVSQLLGDIVLGLGAQVDINTPSVLMSHYTVVGCEFDNGEHVFLQSDVVLPKETLAASPFDLVVLGHIHKAQKIDNCGRPVFYSGPVNGITFNEEGQDKGFWIHEIQNLPFGPGHVAANFIKTPSREFLTMEVDFRDGEELQPAIDWHLSGIGNQGSLLMFPTTSKIVRLHYQCTEEQRKQLSHKAMEQALYKGGAFYVAEIKPIQVITALTKQELSESAGPLENLKTWAEREGFEEAETTELITLSKPLLDTVSAKMPTGKLSGIFEPKRLEVKNYRSYREEEFDFQRIFFATVNGPNGIGKSAFFMDAICDALYEEPRSGEIGSWITAGETARSGSITFEFGMGDTDWRVIRTRAKSGKTTLALQQMVDGQRIDRSADKVRDTQDKIIALLGMDCSTFRCVALIMQDAYGLFMEADKTERMEVLANILGLNVYDQLTDLARNRVTDVGREISKSKEKIAELNEKLKALPELETERDTITEQLRKNAEGLESRQKDLTALRETISKLTAKSEKAKELELQVKGIAEEIAQKETEKTEQQSKITRHEKMLDVEDQINLKSEELEQIKEQITTLTAKQPQLDGLEAEEDRLLKEKPELDKTLNNLQSQIVTNETLLANQEELQKSAGLYRETMEKLASADNLFEQWTALNTKVRTAWEDAMAEEAKIDRLAERASIIIATKQKQADRLSDPNLNCIDVEKATCGLLADAKAAQKEITEAREELAKIDRALAKELDQKHEQLKDELVALNYDVLEHKRLKDLVIELRPKAEQAAELSGKAEVLVNLKSQRSQLYAQINKITDRLTVVTAEIEKLNTEIKDIPALQNRVPALEQWAKAKEELPMAREAITTAKERITNLDLEITGKTEQAAQLKSDMADCLIATTQLQPEKDLADITERQIKSLQEDQNKLHAQIGGINARINALTKNKEELQRVTKEMEPTAKLLVQYQNLAKAFGFDGIPFSIVRAVIPELSAMANEILGQMTGGKMALEMKTERVLRSNNKKEVNALEIWITDWRGNIPYKDRSGGQKVKAALANAFALADLKARRAGIQLGMMFVDEPPFLDAEGVDAYCDALELLSQRYPNMRVVAISHDPRMKARFPQEIEVLDMGEEGSKVRLAS